MNIENLPTVTPTTITCCCGSTGCSNLNHAQNHISHLEKTLRTSAEVGQALLSQVTAMKDQIDRLNAQVSNLHSENNSIMAHNKDLINEISSLSAKLAFSESHFESLNHELEESRKYIAKMNRVKYQTESLESQLELLEQVRESMQNELHTSDRDRLAAQARWRKTDLLLERLARDYEILEQQAASTIASKQTSIASLRSNKTRISVDSENTLVNDTVMRRTKSETAELRDQLMATRSEIQDLKRQLDKHDVVLKRTSVMRIQSREMVEEEDEGEEYEREEEEDDEEEEEESEEVNDVIIEEPKEPVFSRERAKRMSGHIFGHKLHTPRNSLITPQKNLANFTYPTPDSFSSSILYTPSKSRKAILETSVSPDSFSQEQILKPSNHTRSSSLPPTPALDDVAMFDDSFVSEFDESPTRHGSHLQKELRHYVSYETTLRSRFSDLYDEILPSSCSQIPELSTELGPQVGKLIRSTSFESIFSVAAEIQATTEYNSGFIQGHDAHFGNFQRTTLAPTSAAATFTIPTPNSGPRNFDSRFLLSQVNSSRAPRKKESSGWGFGGMWSRIKSVPKPTTATDNSDATTTPN